MPDPTFHPPDVPDSARRALVRVQDDLTLLDALACMLTLEGYVVLRARTPANGRAWPDSPPGRRACRPHCPPTAPASN